MRTDGAESGPNISPANDAPVLSEGQWHALLFGVPDQYRALVVKLAIHHGHLQKPRDPRECALCGERKEATP